MRVSKGTEPTGSMDIYKRRFRTGTGSPGYGGQEPGALGFKGRTCPTTATQADRRSAPSFDSHLFGPSEDWVMPTHIGQGDPCYSVSRIGC